MFTKAQKWNDLGYSTGSAGIPAGELQRLGIAGAPSPSLSHSDSPLTSDF
jgi:hypothetical protein